MYQIDKESWGFRLTFGGFIRTPEMEEWKTRSADALRGATPGFGVYVDMRELKPLAEETQEVMVSGQQLYGRAGMKRSVVVVDSVITAQQFKRLAKSSGIYAFERYLSSTDTQYESKAMAWLEDGVDPDA